MSTSLALDNLSESQQVRDTIIVWLAGLCRPETGSCTLNVPILTCSLFPQGTWLCVRDTGLGQDGLNRLGMGMDPQLVGGGLDNSSPSMPPFCVACWHTHTATSSRRNKILKNKNESAPLGTPVFQYHWFPLGGASSQALTRPTVRVPHTSRSHLRGTYFPAQNFSSLPQVPAGWYRTSHSTGCGRYPFLSSSCLALLQKFLFHPVCGSSCAQSWGGSCPTP